MTAYRALPGFFHFLSFFKYKTALLALGRGNNEFQRVVMKCLLDVIKVVIHLLFADLYHTGYFLC